MNAIATTTPVNPSTPNPQKPQQRQTAKEIIAANVKELIAQLEAGRSDALTAYLDAMSRFHNYSFGNVLEIARQRPDATRVAGLYAWNQLGRKVKKGEKGIRILAPIIGVKRKTDEEAAKDPAYQNKPALVGFRNAYPWERWAVFLHPEQRKLVQKDFNGPARVSGTAGTGKTIVALHRAAHLARVDPQARVLLTTFSEPLANALRAKLRLLISSEPRLGERIEVYSMDVIGLRLYELNIAKPHLASAAIISDLLQEASRSVGDHKFSHRFLTTEWEQVVDGWQLDTWEDYRNVNRLGRKTRLKETQRKLLWSIVETVRSGLRKQGLMTSSGMFNVLARHYASGAAPPFDFAVVDEAQDISIAQIRFLAAIGTNRPNALFFAGDLGQRIFQQPFSWKAAGVDLRGRSSSLKINYRTSHQIRFQADRLLDPQMADVDGNVEERKGTISLFNGPQPGIKVCKTSDDEIKAVSHWMTTLTKAGVAPHEIALFVRSAAQLSRPKASAEQANLKFRTLDERVEITPGLVSVSTMHLGKGLEFRAVAVMACDDEVIPLQERIETVADEADLEDVYNTERHLLYVACTRARDHLLVTSTAPASEFLDDLIR
jgi:superfamily I DNA/RNA helicase